MIKIVAGDFSNWPMNSFLNGQFRLMPVGSLNPESFAVGEIRTLEVVSEATVKKLGGTLAWAAAGGVLFGPAGAIVGSAAGGNTSEVTFIAEFRDGRSFVGVTDPGTWATMRRASLKSSPSAIPSSVHRSGTQSSGAVAKTYSRLVPAELIVLVLVLGSVALFGSVVGFIACWIFGGPTSIFGWAAVVSFAVVGLSSQAAGVSGSSSN